MSAPVPRGLLPAIPETVPRALTAEEQERVCAIADPFGFACRVMLACGARWSEFCRLRAEDLVDRELILRPDEDARRTRGGGRIKGKKIRRVPVPDGLAREIRGHVGRLTAFGAKDNPHFVDKVVALSGVCPDSARTACGTRSRRTTSPAVGT